MAKDCEECPPEGAPGWMVTYGDLMTLLLCFFVLLFSFSSLDKKKFETLKDSMTGAFGVLSGASTSMGSGVSRMAPKLVDKSFDQSIAEEIEKIRQEQVPRERIKLLGKLMLQAEKAMRLVSEEKKEIEKVVHQLEEPSSMEDRRLDNMSFAQQQAQQEESPRNRSEDDRFFAASKSQREEAETARQTLDPYQAPGERFESERADATNADISAGRDQVLMENTGRQRQKDRLSGKNQPEEGLQDRLMRRSEDRPYDYRKPVDKVKTLMEHRTLSGLVKMAPHDASHAIFHFESNMLFEPGSVELKELAKEVVFRMFLQKYRETEDTVFQIEAHTDLDFTPSARYPTPWHLAAARAVSVLNFLLSEDRNFDPKRFAIVSFGAWQPKYRYLPNQRKLPLNDRLEVRMIRQP